MKPTKILQFLLTIFVILTILSFIFPTNGIMISKSIILHFPKFSDIFTLNKKEYADISELFTKKNSDSISLNVNIDSLLVNKSSEILNNNTKNIQPIEFPTSDSNALFPFFEYLADGKCKDNSLHILHFGDSQIEGDRITSYLRLKLQNKFGGNGVGLIFPISVTPSQAFKAEIRGNWQKKTMLGLKEVNPNYNKYGIFFSFIQLLNSKNDSSLNLAENEGEIKITLNNSKASNQNKQTARLFYSNPIDNTLTKVKMNYHIYKEITLEATRNLGIADIECSDIIKNIEFKFENTPNNPCIYGISIESSNGLYIDNVPLRGSSGYGFTQNNFELLRQFLNSLNTKLIIMQFGVNAVPENENTIIPEYSYYEKAFYKQLVLLKKAKSDLSIIVIGVSDRSRKKVEDYETNPNIHNIRKAQRNAAFKAGCAYWDLFEAMGGENSMPSWVFSKPSLANKDFTHFNDRGAKLVAEMFYNSLMLEYYKYINNRNKLFISKNLP